MVKGYTQKQWGRKCTDLPSFIIKRLPVRFTYDNNYFNDLYQGIPIGGYTKIVKKNVKRDWSTFKLWFFENRNELENLAKIVFTGMIDQYYDYKYGTLEYRSLKFETELLDEENYQGNAVVNYTEYEVPYTRIIEHKHFEYGTQEKTVITREYPATWKKRWWAILSNEWWKNNDLHNKYKALADQEKNVIFGGRLGLYKYYDMHNVIDEALKCVRKELGD